MVPQAVEEQEVEGPNAGLPGGRRGQAMWKNKWLYRKNKLKQNKENTEDRIALRDKTTYNDLTLNKEKN